MTRLLLTIALALVASSGFAQTPSSQAADPRILTIPYDPGRVVSLKAATNHQVTVVFPREQIDNVAIGDSDSWQVTLNQQGDALFIKPLRTGSVTNMTVITRARVYSFELSTTFAPDASTPFMVRFSSPGDDLQSSSQTGSQPGIGRYRVSGSGALRPVSIDDDGHSTFIVWAPHQTLPAVFAVDERGDQILLEGQMRDGRYVIDAVHPTLLFRVGRQSAKAVRLRPRL